MGRDCIDTESHKGFDCKMSCVGLYADVGVTKKHQRLQQLEEVPKQLKVLVEAYQRHKKRLVKNFVFNGSAHSKAFGEYIARK